MVDERRFWKMTGSGNDFVFIDGRAESAGEFESAHLIQRLCARGTGVGGDGLVILATPESAGADLSLKYFNADGSVAALCGNATLCTASLAVRLGGVDPAGFALETGSGVLRARIRSGLPEFDLPEIADIEREFTAIPLKPDEMRLGFATAGIPHVVIRVPDVATCDVIGRGRPVRHHRSLSAGANVNFVSQDDRGGWHMRTYERGVEGETLACGTGSVATAVLLRLWGEAGDDVELQTASGRTLGIRLTQGANGVWNASLRGEGRLVFRGETRDL
ncbi:MAG TPA: diaminopimelate epimerase [Gemmatimonadaceae bacterium]